MVAKNDVVTAIRRIEEALKEFAGGNGEPRVRVLETEWGHIHALVGSDKFRGMGLGDRQETIWEYLRKNVEPDGLALLYGVTAMDPENYDDIMRDARQRAIDDWGRS